MKEKRKSTLSLFSGCFFFFAKKVTLKERLLTTLDNLQSTLN